MTRIDTSLDIDDEALAMVLGNSEDEGRTVSEEISHLINEWAKAGFKNEEDQSKDRVDMFFAGSKLMFETIFIRSIAFFAIVILAVWANGKMAEAEDLFPAVVIGFILVYFGTKAWSWVSDIRIRHKYRV